MRPMLLACAALPAFIAAGQARAGTGGTVEGTTTTLGGAPLNGMCGVLYDVKATTQLMAFAPTGTDGVPGHYTQANVPAGRYTLLFVNCGANSGGTGPDANYVPLFLGSTWSPRHASKVAVADGATTMLPPQAVPLGGTVAGTVKDKTTGGGADSVPVLSIPPGGDSFFFNFSWTLVCADATGHYATNTGFQQGVPVGSKLYFAADGWGCTDSHGVFNAGKWLQSKPKTPSIVVDGTTTLNGSVTEAPR